MGHGRNHKVGTKEHGSTTRMRVMGQSNSKVHIRDKTPHLKEEHGFSKGDVPPGMNKPLGGPTK